jgi:hypothetical protein
MIARAIINHLCMQEGWLESLKKRIHHHIPAMAEHGRCEREDGIIFSNVEETQFNTTDTTKKFTKQHLS